MMNSESEKIVRKEIERLKRAYSSAQDKYAYTGSPSTDRTMYKYSVLQDALEKSLAGPSDEEQRLMRTIESLRQIISNCQNAIKIMEKEGDILPGYAGKLRMILEGRDRR